MKVVRWIGPPAKVVPLPFSAKFVGWSPHARGGALWRDREVGVQLDLGMPKPSKPPQSLKPWLGVWTESRNDDEAYDRVLGASGVPWAVRKLLRKFTAQREFALPPNKPLLIRSKMLTGARSDRTNS